jgi:predicted transcriptional regulator
MSIGIRLSKDGVLTGPRARLYDLILARPGIRFTDLVNGTQGHWGSTAHHLYVLERFQFVRSYRVGRCRRYVASLGPEAQSQQAAHLEEAANRTMLELVRQHPGICQQDVAARFPGRTRQAVGHRLANLERLGLVTEVRQGRWKLYYPVQPIVVHLIGPELGAPIAPMTNRVPLSSPVPA